MEDIELDELITRYTFEAELMDMFLAAGEDKGEVSLMFSLLEEKRNPLQEKRLKELLEKFSKNENEDVQEVIEMFV